ncbi:hypothetical protein LTR62_003074 [Meristemomyces frigidus]|uniref:Arrestin-like N-terminal domain-containing protein n=1 Tax=Meristemomyces frigidus TaxID=1508187 RepID=A0AAN7YRY9_9PEZI|nr:hypothetical protein LTR62_003074 [Meristemomyces frigidus]
MNATVVLDQGGNATYTNLDVLSGKVIVRCSKSIDVTNILVKLEGESRTRLLSSTGPNGERPRPQLELHKVLYQVQMVFPPNNLPARKNGYTLSIGEHEYPFKFKIPINNYCTNDKSLMPAVSMSGTGFEVSRPPTHHVKRTLPPTISGFPGEAEIRYFVKTTITRPSFFKEARRAYAPFNFLPIENPRPPETGSEIYARMKHSFMPYAEQENTNSKGKGFLGMRKELSVSSSSPEAPSISVDARLPEPAILTCNQKVPVRIIVKKLSNLNATVHLQSLQISLIGVTKIRAHEIHRAEHNSLVIMSNSNMRLPLEWPNDAANSEVVLDSSMWQGQRLPVTVAPSFEACNISRLYHLDVRVGLSLQSSTKPQNITLPLRLDCEVFSGIAPPPALLEAQQKTSLRKSSTSAEFISDKLRTEGRLPPEYGAEQVPATPIKTPGPSGVPQLPARPGDVLPPAYSEAPPSYEDAVATDLPPVTASRPQYAPPAAGAQDALLHGGDEKKG